MWNCWRNGYYLIDAGGGCACDEKAPAYLLPVPWLVLSRSVMAGHDGIQLAIGQVFTKGEYFLFHYYRDMLTAPCPPEWRQKNLNWMVSPKLLIREVADAICPITTLPNPNGISRIYLRYRYAMILHAAWCGTCNGILLPKGVVLLHTANLLHRRLCYEAVQWFQPWTPARIYCMQDNGLWYICSEKDQTAARKVADNFSGFKNLKIIHCNGKRCVRLHECHDWGSWVCIVEPESGNRTCQLCPYRFPFQLWQRYFVQGWKWTGLCERSWSVTEVPPDAVCVNKRLTEKNWKK